MVKWTAWRNGRRKSWENKCRDVHLYLQSCETIWFDFLVTTAERQTWSSSINCFLPYQLTEKNYDIFKNVLRLWSWRTEGKKKFIFDYPLKKKYKENLINVDREQRIRFSRTFFFRIEVSISEARDNSEKDTPEKYNNLLCDGERHKKKNAKKKNSKSRILRYHDEMCVRGKKITVYFPFGRF